MRGIGLASVLLALFAVSAFHPRWGHAQAVVPRGAPEVVVTPGAQYARSGLYRAAFGAHWRDLWATPVRVPVLDLDTFAGGLTPVRAHTGSQTTSLRLLGADGRQYQFRSVDKDPTGILAPALRRTIAARVLQDGVSSSHPVGSLVASELLEAAGVLHVKQTLAVLPDDPRMGEFREDFAGLFGMIEERPDENEDQDAAFSGALRVTGATRFFERLNESSDDRPNARAFLKARLVDVLLGDRDRHRDQFRWAQFSEERPTIWEPISRDHDEAFVRMDGPLLGILARYYHPLVSWEAEYPPYHRLNWHSREVDRRLLAGLDGSVWDSVAVHLQQTFSDEVIDRAVGALPEEMVAVAGEEMTRILRARRDGLRAYTMGYYRFLAEQVEIRGTDEDELARVDWEDDRYVRVRLEKQGGAGAPFFARVFDSRETREIIIRLWGGDDRTVFAGDGDPPVLVRVVGGRGRDRFDDPTPGGDVRFYDEGNRTEVVSRRGTPVDRRDYDEWVGDDLNRYPPRQWGSWSRPLPWVTVNSDYGAFLGAGVLRTAYGFRKDPYDSHIQARVGVATAPGAIRADVQGRFRRENSPLELGVDLRASGIEILKYYGLGNTSSADGGDAAFYQVSQQQYSGAVEAALPLGGSGQIAIGPFARWAHTGRNEGTFLAAVRDGLIGAEDYGQIGVGLSFAVDTRDKERSATRGVLLHVAGRVTPPLWDVEETFGSVSGDVSTYLTVPGPFQATLSLRGGGARIWGPFPFHESVFLGGEENLRGWTRQRFAGDASLYGGAELRLALGQISVGLPADFGLFGLLDAGRVFVDGESPGGLHRGVGGGFWLAFLDRNNTVTVSMVHGDEENRFYVGLGFAY